MIAAPISAPRINPAFAQAVMDGLSRSPQKTLPASWLYDEVGSALFEVITVLPEYGLTRADSALLGRAAEEIIGVAGRPEVIIELGSGTGTKTRHILRAASAGGPVDYFPIDISRAALENCKATLGSMDDVRIEPIEASYLEGIDQALALRRSEERTLILFLGSTIGNFAPDEAESFLRRIRQRVHAKDSLLLGADLVKPVPRLIAAYDDPLGVTAAFNLNLLARINRELDGQFDLSRFAHEARYNERQSRIEMHLRSRIAQEVRIDALDMAVSFRAGETIWTESSYKFRPEALRNTGLRAGWTSMRQWIDGDWGFAETLFSAAGSL
ncbi:MAG TPA: L-histidine N(alpha)-methyltransferase [Bryobacteraceae bacterium]|nr:L-histidine N(alpha)-methyltransferase [Bryobacteraceae bacterium]